MTKNKCQEEFERWVKDYYPLTIGVNSKYISITTELAHHAFCAGWEAASPCAHCVYNSVTGKCNRCEKSIKD